MKDLLYDQRWAVQGGGGQTPSEIEKKFCYKFKVLGNFLQSGPHDPVARGKLHGPPMCTTVKKRITIIEEL